jgi:TPR repeat protein
MRLASAACLLAFSAFAAAAANQIVPAQDKRGNSSPIQLVEGIAAYQRGDYASAMRLLRPKGAILDYAQAAMWCRKAADQGDQGAEYTLGLMYQKSLCVPQDQAVQWSRKAADRGNADANSPPDC